MYLPTQSPDRRTRGFDGQYAVSGAQPDEVFLQALDIAWNGKCAENP
ncbi:MULTISPECIES: hypothetical protein [Streptomyces]|uniref:Uncharacterized protein n=1 Tax=Streptomyces lutosisoli TaxID=2665721 RepID=A0ABW2VWP8_9ACTN